VAERGGKILNKSQEPNPAKMALIGALGAKKKKENSPRGGKYSTDKIKKKKKGEKSKNARQ